MEVQTLNGGRAFAMAHLTKLMSAFCHRLSATESALYVAAHAFLVGWDLEIERHGRADNKVTD